VLEVGVNASRRVLYTDAPHKAVHTVQVGSFYTLI
jgi:hypothetical protein